MPLAGWRNVAVWGAVALGLALTALGLAYVMYLRSPLVAALLPLGALAVVLVLRQPIVGVYLGLLALPLEILHVRFGIRSVTLAENVFLLTAVSGLLHLASARVQAARAPHLAFAALVVLSAGGLLVAQDTAVVERITRVWFAYLIISLVVSRASRAELERVLLSLAVSAGFVGTIALLSTGPQQAQGGGELVSGRADTGFAHPNVLAFFLLLALPPALVLLARRGELWVRALMGVAATGILGGLLLTLSRSAIIGALVALVMLLALKEFRRVIAGLLAVLVIFTAFNFGAITRSSEVATVSERLGTVSSFQGIKRDPRADIWKRTPSIIVRHAVFGVGEGNFPNIGPRYGLLDPANNLAYDHAHDIFLTIAAELGLTGLAVFLVFLWAIARVARRVVRARGPGWPLGLAVSAALSGLLVDSLAEYPPRTNVIMATVLILVGVLCGLQRADEEEAAAAAPKPAP